MAKVKPPKAPEQPVPVLRLDAIARSIATTEKTKSFENVRGNAILRIFYSTGVRLAELANLRTNDSSSSRLVGPSRMATFSRSRGAGRGEPMTLAHARSTTAAVAMAVVLASCVTSTPTNDPSISTAPPVTASPQDLATAPPIAVSLAPVAPEIVGVWETRARLDASGGQQIIRTYRFFPDATYDYQLAVCRSSTDCALQSSESGYAQTAGGVLTLVPQTDPSDGPRAYPYVVGQDPNVGDIQLHLRLPDGQVDIFYFSP